MDVFLLLGSFQLQEQDDGKDHQQHQRFQAGDHLISQQEDAQQDRRYRRQRPVSLQEHPVTDQRIQTGTRTGDHQQIEDVGADDIADGNFIGPLQRRRHADGQLRHRGSERDDRQSDHHR